MNEYEFTNYMKIITKIRNSDFNFVEEKKIFIELIETMSIAIYYHKKLDGEYDKQKQYSDIELNCCYHVNKYLSNTL